MAALAALAACCPAAVREAALSELPKPWTMLLVSTAFWMGWGQPDERVSSPGSRQCWRPGDPTHDIAERSWVWPTIRCVPHFRASVAEVHFSCLDRGLVADVRNVNAANPAATICAHSEAQDDFCALGTKLIMPAVTCAIRHAAMGGRSTAQPSRS